MCIYVCPFPACTVGLLRADGRGPPGRHQLDLPADKGQRALVARGAGLPACCREKGRQRRAGGDSCCYSASGSGAAARRGVRQCALVARDSKRGGSGVRVGVATAQERDGRPGPQQQQQQQQPRNAAASGRACCASSEQNEEEDRCCCRNRGGSGVVSRLRVVSWCADCVKGVMRRCQVADSCGHEMRCPQCVPAW